MKLERTIFERSHIYFLGFFILVVSAFWLTYLTRIFEQENYRMHLHGIALLLWCCMLVVQPLLIRLKMKSLHRSLGKFSYVLVPALLFTTFDLLSYRMRSLPAVDYVSVALVVNALVAFVLLYGLAIFHRKRSAIHARYMLCTVFPFLTPATDRILFIYFPSTLKYFPILNGQPNVMLIGFFLADVMLIGLIIWDWYSHRRLNVFPVALVILVAYHWSVNAFYKYDFWKTFCDWLI
ncbi:MAG TPA: hypothetical protein VFD46_13160 [Chryseolinea sp.]|nr:hypothetical protein [Chryseolinea sp.]